MVAHITFFPVGNGDMTLIELESGRTLMIDVRIRAAADDPDDETPDVARMLRERLRRDSFGRLFVDALLVSHPDEDHCGGLEKHFHLSPLDQWSAKADKIVVRELWSSPMVFRRASRDHILVADAEAFNREARRRVKVYRDAGGVVADGDKILILGEDEDGKTDDLASVLVRVDETFSTLAGVGDRTFVARLLGPLPKSTDECEEEALAKNRSSTILHLSICGERRVDGCRFLTGGDAEVAIWDRQWARHNAHPDWLDYDILQAPHHCSWHALSYDGWSGNPSPNVSADARKALSQARPGAVIVSSSKPIKDDDDDPPCIGAKREYVAIADAVAGTFVCVGEEPNEGAPGLVEFEVTRHGPRRVSRGLPRAAITGGGAVGRQPLGHG